MVSEDIFKKYLKIAAERYIELNPGRADEVSNLLKNNLNSTGKLSN
ncbi:hypothetical protein [Nostoc sp.]